LRQRFFGNGQQSKALAKSRLSFVLVQDRTGLTNDEMGDFKKELIGVIAKYFVIDERGFDITYKRDTDMTTLLINSPVVVKRQEAIKHLVGRRGARRGNAVPAESADVDTP
jgi:cell division topological specificity factor